MEEETPAVTEEETPTVTAAPEVGRGPRTLAIDIGASGLKASVLNASIRAWSYDAPVNAENIAALDDVTADWAFVATVSRVSG